MASTTAFFTPHDLRMVRDVHVARLANRSQRNSHTGEHVGAPYELQMLGIFLAAKGAVHEISEAEQAFGLSLDYYTATAGHDVEAAWIQKGEWFASAILEDLRAGGDGLRVRCPSRAPASRMVLRPAYRVAA